MRIATIAAVVMGFIAVVSHGAPAAPPTPQLPVEALLYSTMPSTDLHRPEMSMDGDPGTYFKTAYGMDDGDDFLVLLSRPIPVKSITVSTGDENSQDLLTGGQLETSADGVHFVKAAAFNAMGVASAITGGKPVLAVKIALAAGQEVPSLVIREITINSTQKITHVQIGPGRPFSDISQAPELALWAKTAASEMEEFWPDTAALLYSPGFITPNMVNVVYTTGPDVTAVAATGGGVMTVNTKWCDAHPEDTGLTVHEAAHVIQSMPAYDPVWLIEGTADYIRWVKFEPEHFTFHINVKTATYHDAYRTTAAFLGWCEIHYDSCLVTKLNQAVRAGTYKNDLFKQFCGKDVDTLWSEFITQYAADPADILARPTPLADKPRILPTVAAGSSKSVDLSSVFNTVGIVKDGTTFSMDSGTDGGGAAYSADLLGATSTWKNVNFAIGPSTGSNVVTCSGNTVPLPQGSFASLWLLGTSVQGDAKYEDVTVNYTDGSSDQFSQNFSDWYQRREFPGEVLAIKSDYRDMSNGSKDPRAFNIYAYGFGLDATKTVKSLVLPNDQQVKILAVSVAN